MSDQVASGEKRSLSASFPENESTLPKAKRPRIDDPPISVVKSEPQESDSNDNHEHDRNLDLDHSHDHDSHHAGEADKDNVSPNDGDSSGPQEIDQDDSIEERSEGTQHVKNVLSNASRSKRDIGVDAMDTDPSPTEVTDVTVVRAKQFVDSEARLNEQLSMLKNGTHPSLETGHHKLESEREEKLWLHDMWREYELKQLEIRSGARRKQIEDEYENDRKSLRDKLAEQIREEKRKLEEDFVGGETDRPRRNPRRIRHNDENGGEYSHFAAAFELEKKLSLSEREIREDISAINRAIAHS